VNDGRYDRAQCRRPRRWASPLVREIGCGHRGLRLVNGPTSSRRSLRLARPSASTFVGPQRSRWVDIERPHCSYNSPLRSDPDDQRWLRLGRPDERIVNGRELYHCSIAPMPCALNHWETPTHHWETVYRDLGGNRVGRHYRCPPTARVASTESRYKYPGDQSDALWIMHCREPCCALTRERNCNECQNPLLATTHARSQVEEAAARHWGVANPRSSLAGTVASLGRNSARRDQRWEDWDVAPLRQPSPRRIPLLSRLLPARRWSRHPIGVQWRFGYAASVTRPYAWMEKRRFLWESMWRPNAQVQLQASQIKPPSEASRDYRIARQLQRLWDSVNRKRRRRAR